MGLNEFLEKKRSRKQYLMLVGAFIIGIFAMTKGVFAKVFFRDEAGNMYSLSQETAKNLYIKATGQSEGDLHLSDSTNWNVSKSQLNAITVITTSTDWTLYLLQNDNGLSTNDAVIPAKLLVANGNGNGVYNLNNLTYTDEDASNEVHLNWADNAGTDTATIIIQGTRSS